MTTRSGRAFLAASAASAIALASTTSSAGITKAACVDANAKGQDLRRDGKLAAAREQFRACAVAECPAIVADDCTKRLDDVDRAQPSVVFEVKDPAGADVTDVRVAEDGQALAERLNGGRLAVDPGEHTFTFDLEGHPQASVRLVIHEGEADRRERVTIQDAAPLPPPAPPPVPVVAPPPPATPPPSGHTSLNGSGIAGLALGGVGIAGVGVGAVFGLLASSAWSKAKTSCGGDSSQCTNVASGTSYRSTTETDATVATIGFVAGGALLAAGAVVFFTVGRRSDGTPSAIAVAPAVGADRAGLSVKGTFE